MKIGIIGGTGLDNPDILHERKEYEFDRSKVMIKSDGTPADYGEPSDILITGIIAGVECAILARHGRKHTFTPSSVNYRANLLLLHQFGCNVIVATHSIGSLVEEYKPGDFVIIDQLIDRTTKRELTYFDNKSTSWPGVCHISFGDPYNKQLCKIIGDVGSSMDFKVHQSGTVVAVEGPRFSTRSESVMYKSWGAHVIGMTQVPEAQLARELDIPFCAIGMVTDYDSWRCSEEAVTVTDIVTTLKTNASKMISYLKSIIPAVEEKKRLFCEPMKKPGETGMF